MNNWARAMVGMGAASLRKSLESLENVIKSLGEDVPLFEMSVESGGKRVPLDLYLATVEPVTYMDHFFTGAPLFDIWEDIYYIFANIDTESGLDNSPYGYLRSPMPGPKLKKRFSAYTWNRYCPDLREKYMAALRRTLWIADERKFNSWRAYTSEKPELTKTIRLITDDPDLSWQKGSHALRERIEQVKEIEDEVDKIPPERILDIFTSEGRKRMSQRERMIKDLEPKLKYEAQDVVRLLTELGKDYRKTHVNRYYGPKIIY
jgi:hypothetical protein